MKSQIELTAGGLCRRAATLVGRGAADAGSFASPARKVGGVPAFLPVRRGRTVAGR